jgi:hypothetical protein
MPMGMPGAREDAARLHASFAPAASRVRRRLSARRVITGVAAGLAAAAALAGAALCAGHPELRRWAPAAVLVGAAAGLVSARRARLGDGEVALYLDARLGAHEAITTALEAAAAPQSSPARAAVLARANEVLARRASDEAWPRMLTRAHLAAPLSLAALVYVSALPAPLPSAPPPPPGSEPVAVVDLAGLDAALALDRLDARDEGQAERLRALAAEAARIREALRAGAPQRDALADVAKLRDAIAAERLSLGEGDPRRGLEAALGKLASDPRLAPAQRALGDRDLVELDRAMEELANKLEKRDRARAVEILAEAAEAAKQGGAPLVAELLEEQRRQLEERGRRADGLRELAGALGSSLADEGRDALERLDRTGSGDAQRRLASALEEALAGLSAAERKRLAERLSRLGGDGDGQAREGELGELADEVDTDEGRRRLAEALRELATAPPEASDEARRQGALGDAERGLGAMERRLGGLPVAGAGEAPGGAGGLPGGAGNAQGGAGKAGAAGGVGRGGGPGDHVGQTAKVDAEGVRARAATELRAGAPLPGVAMGRAAARAGETANARGAGALGLVGPGEVGAVDRSDVPDEYRAQVGRYFEAR